MNQRATLVVRSIIIFLLLTPFVSLAAGESIEAFSTHIKLEPNGSALVQEEIIYNFGDSTTHHGIFRRIPLAYSIPNETKLKEIEISSIMVTDGEGRLLPSKYTGGGNYMELKIGDPEVFVSGRKRYVIRYTVWGAINQNLPDKDEFYWNATGDEWNVGIAAARADVVLPIPLQELKVSETCYAGGRGSTERCNASTTPQEGTGIINAVRFSVERTLGSREGMTVAVGIPKNIFVIAPKSNVKKLADSVTVYHWWRLPFFGLSAAIPVLVFFVMFRIWRQRGKDPKGRSTIIVEYDVPDHLSPLEVAFMLNNNPQPSAISAAIVDLAVRGFLTIKRTTKKVLFMETEDFQISFIPNVDLTVLNREEKFLYDSLRASGETITVSSLAHKLTQTSAKLTEMLAETLTQKKYYSENPQVVMRHYLLSGLACLFLGFFIPYANFALVTSGLIVIIFAFLMPRRTEHGAMVHDAIEGFKQYLQVAEKDRIDFTNAPEKNPEIFERFLPYAIVFGVEKAWAGKFADMYTEKNSSHWYSGGGSGFNAAALAGSMGSFSASTAQAFTASGGGSGGGGSSGGGGGGGGGGSW